jgi:hypothetical protein
MGSGFLEDRGLYMRLDPSFGAQIHPASEERSEFFFKFLAGDETAVGIGKEFHDHVHIGVGTQVPRAADPQIPAILSLGISKPEVGAT